LNAIDVRRGTIRLIPDIFNKFNNTSFRLTYVYTVTTFSDNHATTAIIIYLCSFWKIFPNSTSIHFYNGYTAENSSISRITLWIRTRYI